MIAYIILFSSDSFVSFVYNRRKLIHKPNVFRTGIEFANHLFSCFTNFFRKKESIYMADENGTGNNLIWAIAMIIIVAIIAGALYYSGFLGGTKKERIDINVTAPSGTR